MPYITQDKRHQLDPVIDDILRILVGMRLDDEHTNTEGNLNYLITRLLMKVYGQADDTRYANINDVIGMLECCKLEFYRKVAVPYENQKAHENGEVEL